jgi:hypothetical protein
MSSICGRFNLDGEPPPLKKHRFPGTQLMGWDGMLTGRLKSEISFQRILP